MRYVRGEWSKLRVMKYFFLSLAFSFMCLCCVEAQSIIRFDPLPEPIPSETLANEESTAITPEGTSLQDDEKARAIQAILPYLPNLASSQQQRILDNPALWHAPQYHMKLQISPTLEQLRGQETIIYTNRTGKNLPDIGVLFLPNVMGAAMEVRNLSVNGAEVASLQVEGHRRHALRIILAQALEPQQQVTVRFDFRINVPRDIREGYGLLSLQEGILSLGHAYGLLASYDDALGDWQLAAPSLTGDLLDSEASFFRVEVHTPKKLVLASNGSIINSSAEAGNSWLENISEGQWLELVAGPARDLFISASYDYEVLTRTIGEQRLRSFYLRSHGEAGRRQAERMLESSARSLAFFSELFPAYPYAEFTIVPLKTQALGMEFPGIIAMNTGLYSDADYLHGGSMRTRLENVTVHEVAHQWFYNIVGSDQQGEPWLDEGLTQYITLLYHQLQNTDDYDYYYHELLGRAGRNIRALDAPVLSYNLSNYVNTIYGMLPIRLVDVAKYVGEDTFLLFLQDYVQRYAWQQTTSADFFDLLLEEYVEVSRREGLQRLLEPWFTLP